ncbi:CZB domain-containing protein [Sulfurimonas sp.]|uniref:CZB domain-containing protein n=1 Tax=Sulfurimonas sp. TaxID=2022749 RepID=UPI003567FCE1
MNKNETLEAILVAKKSHLDRMDKVNRRINGNFEDALLLISRTECGFGTWFYGDKRLKSMLGTQFFENLENLHSKWHLEYHKIYEIFYEHENKKGLLSKLVGNKKISQMELDKAKLYFSELQTTTNELIKVIDASHRRLNALNESYFT